MNLSKIFVNNTQIVGVDDEPTASSDNLVKSGGIDKSIKDVTRIVSLRPQKLLPLIQWYDNSVNDRMTKYDAPSKNRVSSDFFVVDHSRKLTISVGNLDYTLNIIGYYGYGSTMQVIANSVQSYDNYLPDLIHYFCIVVRKADNSALTAAEVAASANIAVDSIPQVAGADITRELNVDVGTVMLSQYSETRLTSLRYPNDEFMYFSKLWISDDINYECIVVGSNNNSTYTSGTVLAPWGSDKETCQAAILDCSYSYCWIYVRNKSNPDANITLSEVWLNGEIRTYVDEKALGINNRITEEIGGVSEEIFKLKRNVSLRPQKLLPLIQWYDNNADDYMRKINMSQKNRVSSDFFIVDHSRKLTISTGNSDYSMNIIGYLEAGGSFRVIAELVQLYDDYLPADISYYCIVVRKVDNSPLTAAEVASNANIVLNSMPQVAGADIIRKLDVEVGTVALSQYSTSRLISPIYIKDNGDLQFFAKLWLSDDNNYECIVVANDNGSPSSGANVALTSWGADRETSQATILSCTYKYCWFFIRNAKNTSAEISSSEVWLNGEIITYVDEKTASGKKRYVNYEDFELQIDTAVADCQSTSLNLQDSQIFEGDKGRIYLPKSYSANGKPTRLIIHCHGASQNYNNGSIFPTSSSFVTIDYFLAKGYAVLDINGMPGEHNFFATTSGNPVAYRSYIKAYEWAVKNYNLYKEIFVIGISAGSIPALQISNITTIPILAAVTYCGIMDFSRAWMLLGGYHPNEQGPAIKAYLADKYGFVGERPTFGNVDPCSDEEWKYIVDNVIQFEGWNTFTMGIKSTITREEYREIVSVVYGSDVPVWIPSDYSFGSVQQMLLAFKIPQRGNLSSYQTALTQEKKLYDTCSIYRKVPLKMFHAVNDDTAPYRYSQYYYEMCKRGGSVVEFRTFSSGGHSPIGSSQSVVIDGVTINTNTLSLEVMDWLQRFEIDN